MDATPDEIESLAELRTWLDKRTLAGLAVQGLDLTGVPLVDVAVDDTLFIGCRLSSVAAADLVARGASVVPELTHAPYPTHPSALYTPAALSAGFETGAMYDTVVYEHFVAHGGPLPPIREALSQRLHDHGIDNALGDALASWADGPVIGVMGGHAEPRGSSAYRAAAELGFSLRRAGALVLTGGGPGVMEAANLGAYIGAVGSVAPVDAVDAAIDELAAAPYFTDQRPYTAVALAVRARFATDDPWAGGLSIPTWLYGHEPANLFAGQIAKYFSNAIREDTILRAARGGIVFAPGKAGTVQEVFQAATKAFYGSDGASGPMVFLGKRYWTEELPVEALLRPLFAMASETPPVVLTDDVAEAVALLVP
ncbi:LOG family protein [Cryptosporangium japonicum]|uniref:LOG family protein n=1 Tax=Cryptosporangium japonicum TaxID=80872 RepID=A0ABP3DQF8_9ACTN